jgi:hypothetical protein
VPYGKGLWRSDFCVERVVEVADKNIRRARALIEAKRAFLWTTKLNGVAERPSKQTSDIKADIRKLITNEKRFKNVALAPRGYVLVWNVTDGNLGTDIGPFDYAHELARECENFTVWQVRAAPLSAKVRPLKGVAVRDWSVKNWLWLILAEVTHKETGSLQANAG